MKPPEHVQYFVAPDDEFGGRDYAAGGFGGSRRTDPSAITASDGSHELRALLDRTVAAPESADALSHYLTNRVNDVVCTAFREQGNDLTVFGPEVVVEESYEKARAGLSTLMSKAREHMVATITKRGDVEAAVAIIDWRALDVILDLAAAQLESSQRFGDLVTETVDPETATAIAALDIHMPLQHRQTAEERRMLRDAMAASAE